jgi:hypothetical protein
MAEPDPDVIPVPRDHSRARFRTRQTAKTVSIPSGAWDNWITAAWWVNRTGSPVTYFRAQWKVPDPPRTDRGQCIFLFNGMQPRPEVGAILQPVLAWDFDCSKWGVSSFFVSSLPNMPPPTYPPVPVEPGQILTGVIRLIDHGGGGFSYRCEFEGFPGTALTVHNIPELIYCVVTLEEDEGGCGNTPYELQAPTDYPNARKTRFRRIKIELESGVPLPRLHWVPCNYLEKFPKYFGAHARVVSRSATNGKVDIYYARRGCLWW